MLLSSHRREFDIQRRLDRIECKVSQYSNQGERGIIPIIDVVERTSLYLTRSFPTLQVPANVSGKTQSSKTKLTFIALENAWLMHYLYKIHAATGFCDAESIPSESGTTFYWPETWGGETATFICPLSPESLVTRSCGIGGVWSQFDENACSASVSGQLSNLINLFNNVR